MVDDEAGLKRLLGIDPLKHIQKALDAFIVSGVQAKRPFFLREQFYDALQFVFHFWQQIRTRL